ncbi:MAG: murein biosynthesis integral membrane protein MurJ [Candidatus Kerfeldbacteria bacterium]|nr:murein biosynthesis integral membrane protein MurJ [Candidatus Kerfeldbacteria bacterium]
MVRALLAKLSTSIVGGAMIIALASVLSRVAGLLRDNLLAKYFAGTATIDMYTAAFKVPDLLFNIVVLGALSASFIPIFIDVKKKYGDNVAFYTASTILNILLLFVAAGVVLGWIVAPWISQWLLATRSLDQQHTTAMLMRLMLCSIMFFTLSNVASGILQSYRRFVAFALAPILYNVGIIIGIVWLYPRFGINGLASGVVLGAALHWLIQLPAVWRTGYRYHWRWHWRQPGVKKMLRLMPPRALALGIVQINAMIIAALALRLPEGSLGIWTWADNLQQFPINVFGVSLALSSFPVFSQALAENDLAKFKTIFSINFRRILFLIIPVSLTVLLLRAQFVRLVLGSFGGGRFDWDATVLTAQVLGFFSVAMFAQATIPLLTRSFFAHHDTKTPVIISIISMVLNIVVAWLAVPYFGLYGLALAFAVSSLASMLLLLVVLRVRCGDLDDRIIIQSVWRIVGAALVMGAVIQGMKYFIAPLVDMRTFIGILLQTIFSIMAGGLTYFAIAWYFHFTEIDIIGRYFTKLRGVIRFSRS